MSEKKYFVGAVIGAIDIEIAYVSQYLENREGWKKLSDNESNIYTQSSAVYKFSFAFKIENFILS